MKRKNLTRNALFTSIISLLLCVSMLVGTTFAWFTDEVNAGMNTIAAGNLDIELYANGEKVITGTKLFDEVDLWEPGVVVYENLEIKNEGTLALKYQMSLNFDHENDLNGHKLSEVLKVAVLDEHINGETREQIMNTARPAANTLSNLYEVGTLEVGGSEEFAVVIFWDPNSNEIDNLYNVNNGKVTSNGQPLHIEVGVNLQATQKMTEEDSFGSDYDQSASILPKAKVTNEGPQTVPVFMGINADEIALDTSFQFQPNETAADVAVSDYKDWHADFVIVANNGVPADSMALAGYYKAWCGDKGWVVMTHGENIAANSPIRLLKDGMNGTTVSYEEICQYGNDGTGFLCGAADLTGVNAGTTITVELRMYETDESLGALSSTDSETGHSEVIGRYSYTFGASGVEAFKAALASGNSRIELDSDIELKDEPLVIGRDVTIDLNGHTISGSSTSSSTSNLIKVNAGAKLTLTGNGTVTFGATTPDTNWGGEGQPAFPGYANNTISNLGELIIDGVTIENVTAAGGASYAIDCYQGSNLTVNSGMINGYGKCAIRMFCNSNTESTNVTVNGGTITGKRAIWVQLPGSNIANVRPVNLTINGGKLISTDSSDCCIYSYSYGDSFANTNINITGGEFIGDVCFGGGEKTTQENVTVTGGTFHGELGRYLANDGWEDIAKP